MDENFFTRKRIYAIITAALVTVAGYAIKGVLALIGVPTSKVVDYISLSLFIIGIIVLVVLFIVWKLHDKFKEIHDRIDKVIKGQPNEVALMNTMDYKDTQVKDAIHRSMDSNTGGFNNRINGIEEKIRKLDEKISVNSFTEADRFELNVLSLLTEYRGERYLELRHGDVIRNGLQESMFNADSEVTMEKEAIKKGLIKIYGDKKTVVEIEGLIDSVYVNLSGVE